MSRTKRIQWMFTAALAATLPLARIAPAQKKDNAEALMQAAIQKETVDGDLKAAIEQYKRIASGGNRSLAARALVRMAECYQKLGDSESRKIYERIVRDYSDQKDAVTIARAHVNNGGASAAAKGDRPVWTGDFVDGFGTISPDGRFLTYVDWAKTGALMLRDLVNGTDRPLNSESWLTGSKGGAQYSAISKDGRQVAYEWYSDKPDQLRIASLQSAGIPEYRIVLQSEEIAGITPRDWSPDGKWIAARLIRKDRSVQLALISAQDGAVRVLKTSGWDDRNGKISFSPDGRYIAYSSTVGQNTSHVFIMTVDGARETAAVAHASDNNIMGWSPDGKYLLFASNRTGTVGLWILAVADGKPQGGPMLVRSDIASSWSLGVSVSGALYTWKRTGAPYVQVSAIDLPAGKLVGPPTGISQRFIESRGRPAWSPDSKRLAFSSCGPLGGGGCSLFIESIDNAEVHEVPAQLNYFSFLNWSPDGNEIILDGTDVNSKPAVYRVNTRTGETRAVVDNTGARRGFGAQWSPEGNKIYYRVRGDQNDLVIIEHDLTSGDEREFLRAPAEGNALFAFSPDRRLIAALSTKRANSSVLIIPAEGGSARTLFETAAPEYLEFAKGPLMWTPDGRSIIAVKSSYDANHSELWQVPIDGSQPRKLDVDIKNWLEGVSLSPDGKYIAFVASAAKADLEVWAIENFLPATPAGK